MSMKKPYIKERRIIKRKDLAFFTRLFDRDNGQFLGHLANLTAEGAIVLPYSICIERANHRVL